jgi:hypothetical protein
MARTHTPTPTPKKFDASNGTARDYAGAYALADANQQTLIAQFVRAKADASRAAGTRGWCMLDEFITDGELARVAAYAIKDTDARKAEFKRLREAEAPKAKASTQADLLAGIMAGTVTSLDAPAPAPVAAPEPALDMALYQEFLAFRAARNV